MTEGCRSGALRRNDELAQRQIPEVTGPRRPGIVSMLIPLSGTSNSLSPSSSLRPGP